MASAPIIFLHHALIIQVETLEGVRFKISLHSPIGESISGPDDNVELK